MACVNITGSISRSGTKTGSCTLSVEIKRDGVVIATIPVVTSGVGSFPYTYQDTNAVTSHTYTATVLANACGCTASSQSITWGGTGPVDPPVSGCPALSDSFSPVPPGYTCGGTVNGINATVGTPFSFDQSFTGSTTVTGSTNAPGLTVTPIANGANVSGTPTSPGNYSMLFTGTSPSCAPCTIQYNIVVAAAGAGATFSARIIKATSAFNPPSLTSFNSAKQELEFTVVGTANQTFCLWRDGVQTAGPFTIPVGGTWTASGQVGLGAGYNSVWEARPCGGNPIPAIPPSVTITGDTCVLLSVTQGASNYRIQVLSGTVPLPSTMQFTLNFTGQAFGGVLPGAGCAGATPGATVPNLTLPFDTGNVAVTAPYDAVIGLVLQDTEHAVCGPDCYRVTF